MSTQGSCFVRAGGGVSQVFLTGKGLQSPLRCIFKQDAQTDVVLANVTSLHTANCISPAGSVNANVSVTWTDNCALPFSFAYYQAGRYPCSFGFRVSVRCLGIRPVTLCSLCPLHDSAACCDQE